MSHQSRKEDHIRICMEEDVAPVDLTTGFERYSLLHCALPEMSLADVDTRTRLFGKPLAAPFVLSAMTGGAEIAAPINRNLAAAAQAHGVAMGVGSQRAAIEQPAWARTYQVRDVAPDILLFANLGAVQLNYGYGVGECRRAVEMIQADALVLHLNALQECFQPGGNTNLAGLLAKIAAVCRALEVPVIVKEVGWGLSAEVARQLVDAGVAALDVAGAGGTSWSQVEKHRSSGEVAGEVAAAFASWGIPTALSLQLARQAAPEVPIIASGGLRNGVEAALALAMGADLAGMARPLLAAAAASAQATAEAVQALIETFRIAMFATGAPDLAALKRATLVRDGQIWHRR